jgi:hypothetical protein
MSRPQSVGTHAPGTCLQGLGTLKARTEWFSLLKNKPTLICFSAMIRIQTIIDHTDCGVVGPSAAVLLVHGGATALGLFIAADIAPGFGKSRE